ncbi:MAG: hypothetical protein P8178_14585 [Candidatus Thiodiazotropha sp.]|jgi:hypothetical protein
MAEAVKHIANTLRFAFTIIDILGFIVNGTASTGDTPSVCLPAGEAGDKPEHLELASPSAITKLLAIGALYLSSRMFTGSLMMRHRLKGNMCAK